MTIRTNGPTPMYPVKISKWERFLDYLLQRQSCPWCHKSCQKLNDEMQRRPLEAITWECRKCQFRCSENWQGHVSFQHLYCEINNVEYHVSKDSQGATLILSFDASKPIILPNVNITPQNIKQKLRTILTFQ